MSYSLLESAPWDLGCNSSVKMNSDKKIKIHPHMSVQWIFLERHLAGISSELRGPLRPLRKRQPGDEQDA